MGVEWLASLFCVSVLWQIVISFICFFIIFFLTYDNELYCFISLLSLSPLFLTNRSANSFSISLEWLGIYSKPVECLVRSRFSVFWYIRVLKTRFCWAVRGRTIALSAVYELRLANSVFLAISKNSEIAHNSASNISLFLSKKKLFLYIANPSCNK